MANALPVSALVVASALACTTANQAPPEVKPPPTVAMGEELGYRQAVEYTSGYVRQRGYEGELLGAVGLGRNVWSVRFGLAPKGSKRVLVVTFEGSSHRVVKEEVLEGVEATIVP